MQAAKHYDMKVIWNDKLQQLLELERRQQNERLQDQARMVH